MLRLQRIEQHMQRQQSNVQEGVYLPYLSLLLACAFQYRYIIISTGTCLACGLQLAGDRTLEIRMYPAGAASMQGAAPQTLYEPVDRPGWLCAVFECAR
jgi:hypothetical protein